MQTVLESAVIPSLLLKVDGKEYTVEFPLSALVIAEEKIGHSLKNPGDWFGLKTADIPAVLEAGLKKHHPEVTAEELTAICDRLNPEALDEVQYALMHLAFPRYMARIEEARQNGTSPNV